MPIDPDFARKLEGYGLTTLHILYGMPDHPQILQDFTWQCLDIHPQFPRVHRFLDFWKSEIEGPLREIRIAYVPLIKPSEWKQVNLLTFH